MICFVHSRSAAVGMCTLCQKGACHECVALESPRLVCRDCAARGRAAGYGWYWWGWSGDGYGYEYKSSATIGGGPLVHFFAGIDSVTIRPMFARGCVAIRVLAVGGLAI